MIREIIIYVYEHIFHRSKTKVKWLTQNPESHKKLLSKVSLIFTHPLRHCLKL